MITVCISEILPHVCHITVTHVATDIIEQINVPTTAHTKTKILAQLVFTIASWIDKASKSVDAPRRCGENLMTEQHGF
jgi:hypothetical protein